jgi:tetratricopeptide (TPR) repeat protein
MDTDQGNGPADATDPKNKAARGSFRSARAALRQDDFTAALTHLEAAAAADPRDLTIQLKLARTLAQLDRPQDAEAAYRRILEQDPTHIQARKEISRAQWSQGRRSEAVDHLQAAMAGDPDNPKSNLKLGNQLLGLWRLEEAEAAFRRVIAAEPTNTAALMGLSRCAKDRGEEGEALAFLRAASACEPGNREIQFQIKLLDADHAGHDWKSELLDAADVLRAEDSPSDQRLWAARLLLVYGVTDIVHEALAPMEAASRQARQLLQMARQLDHLGLSQPPGALSQLFNPEAEQMNALSGVVERLNPGAETLVLVFTGRVQRAFLSLDVLHRILRRSGASLVYLRDLERTSFLGGVVGVASDFTGTVDAFRALMARAGARRLLTVGNCFGCAGALRYGLALGAEGVLGVAPRMGALAIQRLSPTIAAKLAALRDAAPSLAQDVPSLYLAAASPPRVTLISATGVEPEASFLREMSAKVPGVSCVEMPGASAACFGDILARGYLSPLLLGFVANGAVEPEILAALGRPAPKDVDRRPELNRSEMEVTP